VVCRSASATTTSNSSRSGRTLHICTGKVCKRQGSPQLLKFAQDLGLEEISVQEAGCLGNCGKGPNMLLMPQELHLRAVATPNDVLEVLGSFGVAIPPEVLQATQLRLAGNALAVGGDLRGAVAKYEEALALGPARGRHMLLSNLSAAQLQLGDKEAALQAAQAAVDCAPRGFHMAHVRLIDCLYAVGRYQQAAAALEAAVAADGSFKAIPEFKTIQQALRQQRVAA
jgi:tetratricopeptide (TPR) repeat protein